MKTTRLYSATAIFVAACVGPADVSKGPGEPGADPTFTLREERAWAGGTIRIHATGVAKTHGTLEARVGTLPAGMTRMDDSTFVLDVPKESSGSQPVTIAGGGESFEAGTVQVAGFDSWTMIDLSAVSYSMLPLEDPTDAVVALTSVAGLELINLSAGTRVSYPAYRPDCMVAPNPSYRPGVVTIDDDQGVVHALQYDHASKGLVSLGPTEAGCGRHVMEIGPQVFMKLFNHTGQIVRLPGAAPVDQPAEDFQVEDADAVVMSPARNRATMQPSSALQGLPVFSSPEGELAYRIPDVVYLDRVTFSPDGDQLALVYKPDQGVGSRVLRIYDALTGSPIHERALEGTDLVFGLTYDPVRPLLYLVSADSETGRISLEVRRTGDLGAVGRMDAPDNAPPCGYSYCYSATLVRGAGPVIYFVLAHGDVKILRFNLLDE